MLCRVWHYHQSHLLRCLLWKCPDSIFIADKELTADKMQGSQFRKKVSPHTGQKFWLLVSVGISLKIGLHFLLQCQPADKAGGPFYRVWRPKCGHCHRKHVSCSLKLCALFFQRCPLAGKKTTLPMVYVTISSKWLQYMQIPFVNVCQCSVWFMGVCVCVCVCERECVRRGEGESAYIVALFVHICSPCYHVVTMRGLAYYM